MPDPRRPLCEGCLALGHRRQRRCELVDGRMLCAECRTEVEVAREGLRIAGDPDGGVTTAQLTDRQAALMRTLFDRARDGAVNRRTP